MTFQTGPMLGSLMHCETPYQALYNRKGETGESGWASPRGLQHLAVFALGTFSRY